MKTARRIILTVVAACLFGGSMAGIASADPRPGMPTLGYHGKTNSDGSITLSYYGVG